MKPRVISYTRFSSRRQSHGKSEERQEDAARSWCVRNGFELDENISDLGVSAFRGRHRNKGALSTFLRRIQDGKIPKGSYLLIEHFDRLTREEVSDAQDLVKLILREGVNIVTLLDGRVYSRESLNDLEALLVMLMMFSRAHEESRAKGDRVAETFKRKRAEGNRVFGAAPGWLRRKQGSALGEWEAISELADIVVRVFELAAAAASSKTRTTISASSEIASHSPKALPCLRRSHPGAAPKTRFPSARFRLKVSATRSPFARLSSCALENIMSITSKASRSFRLSREYTRPSSSVTMFTPSLKMSLTKSCASDTSSRVKRSKCSIRR